MVTDVGQKCCKLEGFGCAATNLLMGTYWIRLISLAWPPPGQGCSRTLKMSSGHFTHAPVRCRGCWSAVAQVHAVDSTQLTYSFTL